MSILEFITEYNALIIFVPFLVWGTWWMCKPDFLDWYHENSPVINYLKRKESKK